MSDSGAWLAVLCVAVPVVCLRCFISGGCADCVCVVRGGNRVDMAVFCRSVPGLSIAAESPEVGFGHLHLEDHMVAMEKIEAEVGESETLLSVVYLLRLAWTALCWYMKGFVFLVTGGEALPAGQSFGVMAALDFREWEMGGSFAWGQLLSRYLEPVLSHRETGPGVVMLLLVLHMKALGDCVLELGAEEETLFYVVRREHCRTAFPLVLALLWMEHNWPPSVVSALRVQVGLQWVRGTDYVVVGELTGEVVDFTPGGAGPVCWARLVGCDRVARLLGDETGG
eukprot:3106495-Rhodomonas_salina.2